MDFLPLQSAPFDLAATADGGALAFVFGETCVVQGVDEDGGITGDALQISAPEKDAFHRVCFSPDGNFLALGLESGRVQVVAAKNGTVKWLAEGHGAKFVRGVAWSGDLVVSGGDDAGVVVWNAGDGTIQRRFSELAAPVNTVDIRGNRVLAGTGVNELHLYDSGLKFDSWPDYQAERALVYHWDLRAQRDAVVLRGHREQVNSVRFINDGGRILSCSGGWLHGSEHSAFVWDTDTSVPITNLERQSAAVVGSCADANGRIIFTVCWDGEVQAWDGSRVQDTKPIISHTQEIRIVEFSPDGRRVVTTSWDDPPRIWDVESGVPIATLDGHECLIRTVWFSPDGRLVLTGAGRKYPKIRPTTRPGSGKSRPGAAGEFGNSL
ncbi:WD40 repeat domain-containing protein [Fimbriiglobus ruber]